MSGQIAIVEDIWGDAFADLAARRPVRHEPDAWDDRDRLHALAAESSVLVVRNRTQVDAELLKQAPDLKVIARSGVGLDNIDLQAADHLGVVVLAALGANAVSVAEHTLALALAVARGLVALDRSVRDGHWARRPGRELAGGTWGLLSAGATARATARLARGLGMEVVAYDPYVPPDHPEVSELGIRLMPLEDVAQNADVLSVHLPATDRTSKLVDADLLSQMRHHAILVNAGRGEVVDEDALADALERGHLAGAGLDVRAHEPPLPHRLQQCRNVVMTPHIAGITHEAQTRIMSMLCADIDILLSGGTARCAVGSFHRAKETAR